MRAMEGFLRGRSKKWSKAPQVEALSLGNETSSGPLPAASCQGVGDADVGINQHVLGRQGTWRVAPALSPTSHFSVSSTFSNSSRTESGKVCAAHSGSKGPSADSRETTHVRSANAVPLGAVGEDTAQSRVQPAKLPCSKVEDILMMAHVMQIQGWKQEGQPSEREALRRQQEGGRATKGGHGHKTVWKLHRGEVNGHRGRLNLEAIVRPHAVLCSNAQGHILRDLAELQQVMRDQGWNRPHQCEPSQQTTSIQHQRSLPGTLLPHPADSTSQTSTPTSDPSTQAAQSGPRARSHISSPEPDLRRLIRSPPSLTGPCVPHNGSPDGAAEHSLEVGRCREIRKLSHLQAVSSRTEGHVPSRTEAPDGPRGASVWAGPPGDDCPSPPHGLCLAVDGLPFAGKDWRYPSSCPPPEQHWRTGRAAMAEPGGLLSDSETAGSCGSESEMVSVNLEGASSRPGSPGTRSLLVYSSDAERGDYTARDGDGDSMRNLAADDGNGAYEGSKASEGNTVSNGDAADDEEMDDDEKAVGDENTGDDDDDHPADCDNDYDTRNDDNDHPADCENDCDTRNDDDDDHPADGATECCTRNDDDDHSSVVYVEDGVVRPGGGGDDYQWVLDEIAAKRAEADSMIVADGEEVVASPSGLELTDCRRAIGREAKVHRDGPNADKAHRGLHLPEAIAERPWHAALGVSAVNSTRRGHVAPMKHVKRTVARRSCNCQRDVPQVDSERDVAHAAQQRQSLTRPKATAAAAADRTSEGRHRNEGSGTQSVRSLCKQVAGRGPVCSAGSRPLRYRSRQQGTPDGAPVLDEAHKGLDMAFSKKGGTSISAEHHADDKEEVIPRDDEAHSEQRTHESQDAFSGQQPLCPGEEDQGRRSELRTCKNREHSDGLVANGYSALCKSGGDGAAEMNYNAQREMREGMRVDSAESPALAIASGCGSEGMSESGGDGPEVDTFKTSMEGAFRSSVLKPEPWPPSSSDQLCERQVPSCETADASGGAVPVEGRTVQNASFGRVHSPQHDPVKASTCGDFILRRLRPDLARHSLTTAPSMPEAEGRTGGEPLAEELQQQFRYLHVLN